jgi:hypothetical protein
MSLSTGGITAVPIKLNTTGSSIFAQSSSSPTDSKKAWLPLNSIVAHHPMRPSPPIVSIIYSHVLL